MNSALHMSAHCLEIAAAAPLLITILLNVNPMTPTIYSVCTVSPIFILVEPLFKPFFLFIYHPQMYLCSPSSHSLSPASQWSNVSHKELNHMLSAELLLTTLLLCSGFASFPSYDAIEDACFV